MRVLLGERVELFVEVGPGKVLCGLLRQIHCQAGCFNVEDCATLAAVVDRLEASGSTKQNAAGHTGS